MPAPVAEPVPVPAPVAPALQAGPGGVVWLDFVIADHGVGRVSATEPMLGLWVTLEVRRANVDIAGRTRSEICVVFENREGGDWSGGYRLTDRDDQKTHASVRVPAGGVAKRCETLNPQASYRVVLRRDPG